MADIKQIIDDNIYQNGQQRITGIVMNSVLKAMVDDTDKKVDDLTQELTDLDSYVRGNGKTTMYDSAILTKFGFLRSDGTATAESVTTYKRSDYIDVSSGDAITLVCTFSSTTPSVLSVYSAQSEDSFIESILAVSGNDHQYTYTIPLNGKYIRLSGQVQYLTREYSVTIQGTATSPSLTDKVEDLEREKQDKLTSSTILGTINGSEFKYGSNIEIASGASCFKYLIDGNNIYLSRPSANKDLVIKIGDVDIANGLIDFRQFGTLPLNSDLVPSNITELHYSTSDWIAPFQIKAINNIDGDDIEGYTFTGGSHQYNNGATGSTRTAKLDSLEFRIDGKIVSSGSGAGDKAEIIWTNLIQASNTKKVDGSGRFVLKENVKLTFDGSKFYAETELIPLEDITLHLWYGYQFTGIGSGLTEHWGFIGAINRLIDTSNSGDKTSNGIYAYGNDVKMSMVLDNNIDMANRAFCINATTNGAFKSGNKAYFTIANNNATLVEGGHYFLNAEYYIDLKKNVEPTPLKSGSFTLDNQQFNVYFSIADLPNGDYDVIVRSQGDNIPLHFSAITSQNPQSGTITNYTNKSNNVMFTISKVDNANYLRLFQASSYTCETYYEVYAKE